MTIPTTQQLVDSFTSYIETRLGQTTPVGDKAYNRTLATVLAMLGTVNAKYAADRVRANLAITAIGSDLDLLGQEYGVSRIGAVSTVVTASLSASDGVIVPLAWNFSSKTNGLTYQATAQVTAPYPGATGTGVVVTLSCLTPGSAGNMATGSLLAIMAPIASAGAIATVTGTSTTGADAETDDAYRGRILDAIRTQPAGSNKAAFRTWGKTVAGVVQVYPYDGAPLPATSYPGQRTIYVECSTSIQADGIAPGSWVGSTSTGTGLIGQVAQAIKYNPNTGAGQQDIGMTDGGLFVLPITRTPIYVQITSLNVPSGLTSACQADIITACSAYLLAVTPYIAGVDLSGSRNDAATQAGLMSAVYSVLLKYGATIQSLGMSYAANTFVPVYQCSPGEKLKLGSVSFV